MEFIPTPKGNRLARYMGHTYRRKNVTKTTLMTWYCVKDRTTRCRAKLVTKNDEFAALLGEHECENEQALVEVENPVTNGENRPLEESKNEVQQWSSTRIKKSSRTLKKESSGSWEVHETSVEHKHSAFVRNRSIIRDRTSETVKRREAGRDLVPLKPRRLVYMDLGKGVPPRPEVGLVNNNSTKRRILPNSRLAFGEERQVATNDRSEGCAGVVFTTTKKGRRAVIHNGYSYHYKRQGVNGEITWRCSKERTGHCRGSMKTKDGVVVRATEHVCGAARDGGGLEIKICLQRAKKHVRQKTTLKKTKKVYRQRSAAQRNQSQLELRDDVLLREGSLNTDHGGPAPLEIDNTGLGVDSSFSLSLIKTEPADTTTIKQETDLLLEEHEIEYSYDGFFDPRPIRQEIDYTLSLQPEVAVSETIRQSNASQNALSHFSPQEVCGPGDLTACPTSQIDCRTNVANSGARDLSRTSPQDVGENVVSSTQKDAVHNAEGGNESFSTARPTSHIDDAYVHYGRYVASMLGAIGGPRALALQQQITVLLTNTMAEASKSD